MNTIEPLNSIRAQLETRDTELTSSLESIEREREIVRKQLDLIQELASLEEQRAGTGAAPAKTTAAGEAARPGSQTASTAGSAGAASEGAASRSDVSKAESAKSEPARPEPAKPEPVKAVPEAPAAKDEPAAAPFGRGPSPWPRSTGESDTELLRRIRAS